MRLNRITEYLLSHRWQTYLITLLISFVPVLGIVGILLAGLVTLRKSIVEGAALTVIAMLPFAVSFVYLGNVNEFLIAISSYILTWIFAVLLRRGTSWSQLLQMAALAGVFVISIIHMVYPSVAAWWEGQLLYYYKQASTMISTMMNQQPAVLSEAQIEAINLSKQYMTGITIVAVLFNAMTQLIVVRWWQAAVYAPGMLRGELHNIRLTPLAGALFVLSMIFGYLGNSVVLDMMPVLYALFAASGLSLMHYLLGLMKSSSKWFWLCLIYITLVIGFPSSVVLLAMLGLLDIWMDMRKRLQKI